MREVDRLMVEGLSISLSRMMENAGARLVSLIRRLLGADLRGRRIAVLAGPGGNGGGGMVAARHLAVAGAEVSLALSGHPERLAPMTAEQHAIVVRMGIPIGGCREPVGEHDLVIDSLLGYSQAGAPHGMVADLIRWSSGKRVIALDVPSGIELSTGRLFDPHVQAEATMTLALPKEGLRGHMGGVAGALYLADIGVPPAVHERLGLRGDPLFTAGPIVRVTP